MTLQTILKDCQLVMDGSKYVVINYDILHIRKCTL